MSEPIRRVLAVRPGIEGAAAIEPTDRVERDEPREDREPRRRPAVPDPPPSGRATVGDDGFPHVDVQA